MINDSNKFVKELNEPGPRTAPAYWFIFQGDKLLVEIKDDEQYGIPLLNEPADINLESFRTQYLGRYEGTWCYAAELSDDTVPPENLVFHDLRRLYGRMDFNLFQVAGYAFQLHHWERMSQYCGRCGSKTEDSHSERAKICTRCEAISYPRLSPSMITAVIKDDKILLARSRRFKRKMYSVLAGFVEPGETLEECVKREVMEEAGIEVKNIRYFGSQPWPFPDSLMVGFTAEYKSGEIRIDEEELEDAGWFSADDLPVIPHGFTIARQLIDWFTASQEN